MIDPTMALGMSFVSPTRLLTAPARKRHPAMIANHFGPPRDWLPGHLRRRVIVHAEQTPPRRVRRDARAKVFPTPRRRRAPRHLGESGQSGQQHVLRGGDVLHRLGPERRFDA